MGMALSTLPGVFLCLMALGYTLDLPRLDQWEFIPFLEKAYNGTLSWHDFWAQHNEHRIVFPRLVFLLLAKLTAWNLYYEVAANLLLGLLIFILIAWQAHVGYARCQLPAALSLFMATLAMCLFAQPMAKLVFRLATSDFYVPVFSTLRVRSAQYQTGRVGDLLSGATLWHWGDLFLCQRHALLAYSDNLLLG